MIKNLFFLAVLILTIGLTGCTTYTIAPKQTTISNFVGETVPFQVDYSVTNGKITSPQLVSNCASVAIQSQTSDNAENTGSITATLLIKSYKQESNCLTFKSNEKDQILAVSIMPQKQASFLNIDYPKIISFNEASKVTSNLLITARDTPQNLQLALSSQTPNLKYMVKESDVPDNINSAIIKFSTGDYQDSAKPIAYIYLPDPGFSSVELQPIFFKLYIEQNGQLYLVDETSISGISAKNKG